MEEEIDAPRVEVLAARRDAWGGGHGEVRAVGGAAGVWPPANCQLPTANCQLPTANCKLQTAYLHLPSTHSATLLKRTAGV
jgi:hypothetical protein